MTEHNIYFNSFDVVATISGIKTQKRFVITPQPYYNELSNRTIFDRCPFGKVGDKLIVKEAWSDEAGKQSISKVLYKADWVGDSQDRYCYDYYKKRQPIWKSSLHMPKKYSRLTLTVTNIYIQYLIAISDEDAIEEGITKVRFYPELWNKSNAKRGYGWDTNPLVWVVEYIVDYKN